MNRIRYTLLQLILDSSRTKEVHIPLDKLSGIIERITPPVDRSSRLIINFRPRRIFPFGDITISNAECS